MIGVPKIYVPKYLLRYLDYLLSMYLFSMCILGAVATAAALIDRHRNGGIGRDIHASRLAGGLSAIGALSLDIGKFDTILSVFNEIGMLIFPNHSGGSALPKHLESVKVSHIRQGITAEEMEGYIKEATVDPLKQLWLEQVLPILQSNCIQ